MICNTLSEGAGDALPFPKAKHGIMKDRETHFRLKRLSDNRTNHITRDSLGTALVKLMAEKDLEEITVTELVKTAGVSRQSFYRNYSRVEDIVNEVENQLLGTMYDSFHDPRYLHDRQKWFLEFYSLIGDHPDISTALCKAGVLEPLFDRFLGMFEAKVNETHTISYYNAVGLLGGLYALATHWVLNGMKESPGKIASLSNDFYERVLAGE